MNVQICVDAADGYALAKFYADAGLGYALEDNTAGVRAVKEQGLVADDDIASIDGRLYFRGYAACVDATGRLPRLLFQPPAPEPKTGKNRLHIDFQFLGDEVAWQTAIDRLVTLGATRLWDGQQGPHHWVTMADPEGNEFCVGV